MTTYYSNESDFQTKSSLDAQSSLVTTMLTDIDDTGATVLSEGLSHLYAAKGDAVLGANKTSTAFTEAVTRVETMLASADRIHKEVLQNIDSKLVKGLDLAFESLNQVNSKKNPYKTVSKYDRTSTYTTYDSSSNYNLYASSNSYSTQTITTKDTYTLDEVLATSGSPIQAVKDTYKRRLESAKQSIKSADDLSQAKIDELSKMSDEELLETFYPRITSDNEYSRIKASTYQEVHKNELGILETGADILAGLTFAISTVLIPVTGGATIPLAVASGSYVIGSSTYSAVTGNTMISGTQLTTTERVIAGVEALTTLVTLGSTSVGSGALKVSEGTAKVINITGKVGNAVDEVSELGQLGYGLYNGDGASAILNYGVGKSLDIGLGKVAKNFEVKVDASTNTGKVALDGVDIPKVKKDTRTTVEIIDEKLQELGMTWARFDELRNTRVTEMNAMDYIKMKYIREAIPNPTADTVMQKIMPVTSEHWETGELVDSAAEMFNSPKATVKGFVSKREEVKNINNIIEAIEGLRLDYEGSPFVETTIDANGNRVAVRDVDGNLVLKTDAYLRLVYTTENPDYMYIPYANQNGEALDGAGNVIINPNTGKPFTLDDPASGHGFIKSDSGEYLVPEYRVNGEAQLKRGSQLFLHVGNDKVLVGEVNRQGVMMYVEGVTE
ncbi:hypothetical protein ACVR05_02135 [Streptococcus caprae]|uniref:LXG domain-containing protein n=1 Tax=Streptococcus caprae TaxID=1640501 RepID=A0ABV8CWG6_9STRE